jgi:hypothetical protein
MDGHPPAWYYTIRIMRFEATPQNAGQEAVGAPLEARGAVYREAVANSKVTLVVGSGCQEVMSVASKGSCPRFPDQNLTKKVRICPDPDLQH